MILLKSSNFIRFNCISWQNGWFTSQIWYDCFPSLKFIWFSGFFPEFPDFFKIINFLENISSWTVNSKTQFDFFSKISQFLDFSEISQKIWLFLLKIIQFLNYFSYLSLFDSVPVFPILFEYKVYSVLKEDFVHLIHSLMWFVL